MRYMLTGADWSADEAYRMGLVQEVTAPVSSSIAPSTSQSRSQQPLRSVCAHSFHLRIAGLVKARS